MAVLSITNILAVSFGGGFGDSENVLKFRRAYDIVSSVQYTFLVFLLGVCSSLADMTLGAGYSILWCDFFSQEKVSVTNGSVYSLHTWHYTFTWIYTITAPIFGTLRNIH